MTTQECESAAHQWQETIKILIQSFNRILTKYIVYEHKIESITEHIYQKSFYLFRITNKNIFTEVSIILKILLNSQILDYRRKQTLLEEMENWLKKNKNQGQAVHDMMNILTTILEDINFVSIKTNFQLLMRIYTEIMYFSSFSDEYSTYFYNLEILTKNFLKNLFLFLNDHEKTTDFIFPMFINCLPEIFVTKIINKKANETGVVFLGVFFDEIMINIKQISIHNFRGILEKLFLIVSLRSLNIYITMIETEKECLYIIFYEKLKLLIDKLIVLEMNDQILVIFELIQNKFLLLNEMLQLRNVKFKEKIIEKECNICIGLIFYGLAKIEQFSPQNFFEKFHFFAFLQNFKNCFLKIDFLFGIKIEKQLDKDECFLNCLYKSLASLLRGFGQISLKFELVCFLKTEFGFYADLLKNNQSMDKKLF